jgi:NAD(P)-dependent dehydrogenase (short-subunit alcohol dehydrogenase family)/NH3-dependent NAD+ synthetase
MSPRLVTIVTGGGRGIGRAIALRLAELTAVIVVGRTRADLEAVCEEIKEKGGEADLVVGDVADSATAAATTACARGHGWAIANLVCNAGIAKGGPLVNFDPAAWQAMFNVNVHGSFHFIQACLPEMIARKQGAIAVISSTLGLKGHKNDAPYSATKFALIGLCQSLADEVRKHNIGVYAICPGFVDTDMTRRSIAGLMRHRHLSQAEAEQLLGAANPQGRILQPEEIAEAVAFCSTDKNLAHSGKAMELTADTEPRILQLINWVRQNAAPARQLLVPISGGSDSALAFYICSRAYPEKTRAVFVGKPNQLRSRLWFEAEAPGAVSYESIGRIKRLSGPQEHGGDAEIARWAKFLALANATGAWLVGSRNRTEEYTGLYSLASRVATFLPLGNVWKSEVMTLCREVGVPEAITASSRHADPDCGRPQALSEIPLEAIDLYLRAKLGELPDQTLQELTTAQVEYLDRVVAQNAFKRSLPTRGPALFKT